MKKILLFTVSLFLAATALAQTRVVTGKVTSADEAGGFPGVSVLVQGTNKGVSTDMEGNYSLEVGPGENTLIFSFVGYATQTVDITNRDVVDVVLESDATDLDEVVIIGYGTIRKSDLTGAISSVRGEDLVKIPAVSPMQALQGKVPGLQVSSSTGAPGASPVVRIRGQGTFNDSSPLYVVDGIILQDINFVNPSDIASMEILKDASATAIYGARGANGVIMVTTKRGNVGEKPLISFNAEYSVQKINKTIDLLNGRDYALYVNAYDPGTYNNPDVLPDTDWQNLLFNTAPMQNYSFSAAGSSEKSQYYIGLSYFSQKGIIDKSNYERVSFKLNNTFNLAKSVRFGNNITITPFKQQNTNGNVVFTAYRALPVLAPYQPDGRYTEIPNVGNPLADIAYTNSFDSGVRGVGNVFGEVDFLKGFTFKSSLSIDAKYLKNKSFTPVFFVSAQQQNSENDLTKLVREELTWIQENTLTYKRVINKHRIDALVGFTVQDTGSEFLNIKGENIIREDEDFWYFNPTTINPTGIEIPNSVDANLYYSMMSTLFRVNYAFDDRYLLTASFRRDGSSKFSEDNRFASFPSFALGWNVINESFFRSNESLSFISNLKLRASWGKTGNEKIDYLKQYSLVDNGKSAVFGESEILYPGATYGVTGNADLIWETTTQTDFGLELGFLNDKLTFELDYYHRVTDDILIPLELPGYLGNGAGAKTTFNAGSMLNSGFEFVVNWDQEFTNGLSYRITALGTTIHNEVTAITGGGSVAEELFGPESLTRSTIGNPIGSFYGYKDGGVFQSVEEINSYPHLDGAQPGDVKLIDLNDDGEITQEDRTSLGSPIPTFLYGFSLGVAYKGIDLSMDFQGESGAEILNYKETVRPDRYNFEAHANNFWTPSNPSNEPRASEGGTNWGANDFKSSRFIQSADFFRLRNITLAYSLPASLTDKAKMKSARIYVRATNAFTLQKYTGYTTEIANESPLENKVDRGTYPVVPIYSVGLNVTF